MNSIFTSKLFLFLLVIASLTGKATTLTVTSINDSGAGSLREAIASSSAGDTVRFDPALIAGGNATIVLASEIAFSKPLTIVGLYTSTDTLFISGNNNSRIFSITFTTNVTLDSLALIDGNGNGAVQNSTGGAVLFHESDSLFIKNTLIKDNIASSPGGGVYVRADDSDVYLSISNSKCSDNTSHDGGAIHIRSDDGNSTLIVNNVDFHENFAAGSGGAIYAYAYYGRPSVRIDSSHFEENTAFGNGGALYIDPRLGSSDTTECFISNSSFYGNDADVNGGGIYLESLDQDAYLSIDHCDFNGNSASGWGGAIGCRSDKSIASVSATHSTFSGNSAGVGSAILCHNPASIATVSISSSTIDSNNNSAIYVWGDGLEGSEIEVSKSTFYGNTAQNNGGAINCQNGKVYDISNCTFYENNSSTGANAIYNDDLNATYDISGSIFYNSRFNRTIQSGGYNIFSDIPTGTVATDVTLATQADLNLQALADNGGVTKTMWPGSGSIAINMGDPTDLSDAQNGPVFGGRRDVGAAEVTCEASSSSFDATATSCLGYTVPSGDSTYTQVGTYTINDTIPNGGGCDSVMTISITITAPASILDQSITAPSEIGCPKPIEVDLANSEEGVYYAIADDTTGELLSEFVEGNASSLSFTSDTLSETTKFRVVAISEDSTSRSVEFNATGRLNAGSGFDLTEQTIEMSIKPGNLNATNYVVASMRNALNDSTRFSLHVNPGANTVGLYNGISFYPEALGITLSTTTWYQFTFVMDGSSTLVYVDGTLRATITEGMDVSVSGKDLTFGGSNDLGFQSENFIGYLDNIRVWDFKMSASEVEESSEILAIGAIEGLVLSYPVQEAAGCATEVIDASSNGNNANFEGEASWANEGVSFPTLFQELMTKPNLSYVELEKPEVDDDISYCSSLDGWSTGIEVGYDSYLWSNGDTTNNTTLAIEDNPVTVTVTKDGCTLTSDPVNVDTIAAPTVSLAAFDPFTIDINASSQEFPAGMPSGGSYLVALDSSFSTVIPFGTSVSFVPDSVGLGRHLLAYSYTDTATTCINTAFTTFEIADLVGLNEINFSSMVSVYPNPTNGFVSLDFGKASVTSIEMISSSGVLVLERKSITSPTVDLSLEHLPKGIYFVRMHQQDGTSILKVVKE